MTTQEILQLLSYELLGNPLSQWGKMLVLFLLSYGAIKLVIGGLAKAMKPIAKRSTTQIDDLVEAFLRGFPSWTIALLSLCFALQILQLPPMIRSVLTALQTVILVGTAIILAQELIEQVLRNQFAHSKKGTRPLPAVLRVTISIVLWLLGVLLILSNIGVNILSLVAGLGIGGVAIALAVQNILSDMLSSYSLYFDEPFREGDFIVLGDYMGTVKKIGLKTTRLQSLEGEEIVVPNQELTSTRVRNFKKMKERRIVLRFGVTYDTKPVLVEKIPGMLKDIVGKVKGLRFDRAHFFRFGDSSLDFELVYYLDSNDYNTYMDMQQKVNLAVLKDLTKAGVSFAFPTRTVHVVKE